MKESVNVDSSMVRENGVFRRDKYNGEEVIVTNNTKIKTSPHVASKLSGVTNPNQAIIVPTFFRGEQCMPMLWKTQPMYRQSNLQSLISTIRSGNALTLTGAGFSLPANLLSWSDLLQALLEKAKVTSKIDKAQYNFIQGLVSAGTAKSYDQAAQVSTCFNMKMLFTQAQLTRVSFEHSWTKESWRFPRKRVNANWDVKVASHWLFVDVTSHAAVSNVLCCVLSIFNCTHTFRKISIFCGIRHIKIFNDIPWKAALTTNYDIFASGPTPQCSDVG